MNEARIAANDTTNTVELRIFTDIYEGTYATDRIEVKDVLDRVFGTERANTFEILGRSQSDELAWIIAADDEFALTAQTERNVEMVDYKTNSGISCVLAN